MIFSSLLLNISKRPKFGLDIDYGLIYRAYSTKLCRYANLSRMVRFCYPEGISYFGKPVGLARSRVSSSLAEIIS